MPTSPPDTATIELAHRYRREGRATEAAAVCERLLERRPADLDALSLLGELDLEAGRPLAAARRFEQVLALDPKSVADLRP